jgi:peroxiredoxin
MSNKIHTKKCCICEKTVYAVEEVSALGRIWHKSCFKCGGSTGLGCGRTVVIGQYLDHDKEPFCSACYNKTFKPKGFGFGSAALNTEEKTQIEIPKVEEYIPVIESIKKTKIEVNGLIPSAEVDLIIPIEDNEFKTMEKQDIKATLKSHQKALVFGVPGAFTPTCSEKHLPGFIQNADLIRSKGIDAIYCLSVNDAFVVKAWAKSTNRCHSSGIIFIADGNGDFTEAIGLVEDGRAWRMGNRCTRFAAIVENGVLKNIGIDLDGLDKSSAEAMLQILS